MWAARQQWTRSHARFVQSRKVHASHTLRKPGFAAAAQSVPQVVDTASELMRMNEELGPISGEPIQVLQWAMQEFDGRVAMSTSFGIQAAVLLHLATRVKPDIPVVWVDTGYLPAETYQYAEELTKTLNLNLKIASNATWTPARMEALHGKLWEKDDANSHQLYGKLRKVEPLNQALAHLEPDPLVLLSGLRASQTKARANMPPIGFSQGRFKLLPMLRMTDEEIHQYMDKNDLPSHPLQSKGYVTVGDWHSSRPVKEGEDPRNTRFGGKFQECGLHVDSHEPAAAPKTAAPTPSAEAARPAAAQVKEVQHPHPEEEELMPDSLKKTGVKELALTRHHPETGLAVIMVKKLTEDGSFCRKCLDVTEKMAQDNLTEWVGAYTVADVTNANSDGTLLAKYFNVATAPFFLTRDKEAESVRGEWSVVRSYLQLRNQLTKAHDHVLAQREHKNQDPMVVDEEYRSAALKLEKIKLNVEKMQIELHERIMETQQLEKVMQERKHLLGLD